MAEALKDLRAVYAETLVELGRTNTDIMVLEADLMKATGTGVFAQAYPDRAVNVGVAEADMVCVASGLSSMGKIPFAATFGCFASRRAFDQFYLSANYAKLNVKLVGTDPGVCAGFNGGTHMPFEDLAMMRIIPGLTIIEPSDPVSLAAMVKLSAETYGCVYLRLQRKGSPALYPADEKFEFGKAKILREGSDITLVALGALMVGESLKAADELAAEGIRATVIDALSLKPLDGELIMKHARRTKKIVTLENHQFAGGLGSAVAELIAESGEAFTFARIGIKDEFGEVGTQDWLAERFGLNAASIVKTVKAL